MHTYRVTPLALWNARAAGHDAEQVVDALVRYSRYPVPHALLVDIADTMDRFGRLTLAQNPVHGLVLTTTDRAVLEEVVRSKRVAPMLGARIDADTVVVHPSERGRLKQALLKVGWPAEDLAGYVDGEAHPIELDQDDWHLRDYQREAVEGFWAGGSGVVVLPCGAGKTLVGAAAMAEAKATTLILVTNTVAGRQWKRELIARTSLTEEEIGEYSGERKEIRPVTIATYQVMTTRRKGEYRHLDLFDARDWGLIVYDEVHLLPAPVFRMTADLQSRRRLGLTATLVREDGREDDVFSLIGPKRYDAPWKDIEAQGYIAPAECIEVRVTLDDDERMTYAVAEPEERYRIAATAATKLPVVRRIARPAPRRADAGHRRVPRPARGARRGAGRPGDPGLDDEHGAGAAVRRVPQRRDHDAGGLQGRQLLHRPARGRGRHPGVGHLRLPAGGGAAARPGAAAQGRRPAGALLHGGQPRHPGQPSTPRTGSASSPSRATPTRSSTPTTWPAPARSTAPTGWTSPPTEAVLPISRRVTRGAVRGRALLGALPPAPAWSAWPEARRGQSSTHRGRLGARALRVRGGAGGRRAGGPAAWLPASAC